MSNNEAKRVMQPRLEWGVYPRGYDTTKGPESLQPTEFGRDVDILEAHPEWLSSERKAAILKEINKRAVEDAETIIRRLQKFIDENKGENDD